MPSSCFAPHSIDMGESGRLHYWRTLPISGSSGMTRKTIAAGETAGSLRGPCQELTDSYLSAAAGGIPTLLLTFTPQKLVRVKSGRQTFAPIRSA